MNVVMVRNFRVCGFPAESVYSYIDKEVSHEPLDRTGERMQLLGEKMQKNYSKNIRTCATIQDKLPAVIAHATR